MAVTRERFEQGLTYEAYREQMTRNRERFEENERTLSLPAEEVAYFAELPETLNVLVLAEDWCGDVIANLPVLGRLAQESGKLNVRVFPRDENLDVMNQYLNQGVHQSIPVFVFFDEEFREIGHWIERPALVSELQSKMLDELFATDPAFEGIARGTSMAVMPEAARLRLGQAFGEFRSKTRETADREVVREIRALLERDVVGA
jgi:hypothetical protein